MSGMKARESWRCPALVTRMSGRQPESASRWTLVLSPPRDLPSASRSLAGLAWFVPADGGSLSFRSAPCPHRDPQPGHPPPPPPDIPPRPPPPPPPTPPPPHPPPPPPPRAPSPRCPCRG